jgi:hypothetical protein
MEANSAVIGRKLGDRSRGGICMLFTAAEWVWAFPPFVSLLTAEMRGYLGLFQKILVFFEITGSGMTQNSVTFLTSLCSGAAQA